MNVVKRDELFESIQRNRTDYTAFLNSAIKFDREYQDNFPKNDWISILEYNKVYEEKMMELNEEREKLDLEWKKLNEELREMLKC